MLMFMVIGQIIHFSDPHYSRTAEVMYVYLKKQ